MKKRIVLPLVLVALAVLTARAINLILVVPVPDTKYTNMVNIASNQGQTVETFLSNSVIQQIEGNRLTMLVELWNAATPAQQENALNALRPPLPPPPPPLPPHP